MQALTSAVANQTNKFQCSLWINTGAAKKKTNWDKANPARMSQSIPNSIQTCGSLWWEIPSCDMKTSFTSPVLPMTTCTSYMSPLRMTLFEAECVISERPAFLPHWSKCSTRLLMLLTGRNHNWISESFHHTHEHTHTHTHTQLVTELNQNHSDSYKKSTCLFVYLLVYLHQRTLSLWSGACVWCAQWSKIPPKLSHIKMFIILPRTALDNEASWLLITVLSSGSPGCLLSCKQQMQMHNNDWFNILHTNSLSLVYKVRWLC